MDFWLVFRLLKTYVFSRKRDMPLWALRNFVVGKVEQICS